MPRSATTSAIPVDVGFPDLVGRRAAEGTVLNYPIRPWHRRGYYITGSSAPPDLAAQMWNRGTIPTMVAKLYSGNSIDQTIAWAKQELEGFVR